MGRRVTRFIALLTAVVCANDSRLLAVQDHRNFEIGATRPVLVSADGTRLFVVHTPRDSLLVYTLSNPLRPRLIDEIDVGLRPVALRERSPDCLWVVDRLGDSISIVSLKERRVTRRLDVGDEPSDVVLVEGRDRTLAFVSLALENRVRVFDADSLQAFASIDVLGMQPHELVYDARRGLIHGIMRQSGNGTTVVPETDPLRPLPGIAGPGLPRPPHVSSIVDARDPLWSQRLGVDLADIDVFSIDVASLRLVGTTSGVGTTLHGIALLGDGRLAVTGSEARNRVRFEPALRGHFVTHRASFVDPDSGQVEAVDVNPDIDYERLPNPAALATALAEVTDVQVARDGTLYVAAFGTDRIAHLDVRGRVLQRIEVGTTAGTRVAPREKRGPRGLALHPQDTVAYVACRISSTLVVVDLAKAVVVDEVALPEDPLPRELRAGRGFLYDAKLSGNGTASCASCHVDAGIDGLAWDLGDPNGPLVRVRTLEGALSSLHPMKGALTTQTLIGLAGDQPFHWRGDKARFADFNGAFETLLGGERLSSVDMQSFEAFVMSLEHMPNPHQERDRSYARLPLGESAEDGRRFFHEVPVFMGFKCASCHSAPGGTNGGIFHGSTLQGLQPMKTAQLQTTYRRMGRRVVDGRRASGFGLLHDGSEDSVVSFLSRPIFANAVRDEATKRMLERFVLSFDSGTAPTVGHAHLLEASDVRSVETSAFLDLMIARAEEGDCDFVLSGDIDGRATRVFYDSAEREFVADRSGLAFTRMDLVERVARGQARFLARGVPPGSGRRQALDTDRNGILDGDEGAALVALPSASLAPGLLRAVAAPRLFARDFGFVVETGRAETPAALVIGRRLAARDFGSTTLLVDAAAAIVIDGVADERGTLLFEVPLRLPALVDETFVVQALIGREAGVVGSEALRFTVHAR